MDHLEKIKQRYLKEPFERKLGHLASDLARISSTSRTPSNSGITRDVIEESKFFIEWVAPESPLETQILLAEMQSKLALWQRHLVKRSQSPSELEELATATRNWSRQLLEVSGLLS
jgi:hypothetical protein